MNRSVLALASEPRAGWPTAVSDAGGLVTVTVPAVPGSGVPVLDSILPLVSSMAWNAAQVEVVVGLLDDEDLTDDVALTVIGEFADAKVWTERSCPREGKGA